MHFPIVNPFFFVRDLDFEYILLYYNFIISIITLCCDNFGYDQMEMDTAGFEI